MIVHSMNSDTWTYNLLVTYYEIHAEKTWVSWAITVAATKEVYLQPMGFHWLTRVDKG